MRCIPYHSDSPDTPAEIRVWGQRAKLPSDWPDRDAFYQAKWELEVLDEDGEVEDLLDQ